VAQKLKESIEQRSKRRKKKETLARGRHMRKGEKPCLVIDGTPIKDKFLIWINGKKVALPAKSFKYLVKLAWAVFKNKEGWIHKNDLEPGENQTRYLHRLKKQITPYLEPNQTLMENNRLGCYRLSIPVAGIKINAALLTNSPDSEISRMAEELLRQSSPG
jgi:hypothetical protein